MKKQSIRLNKSIRDEILIEIQLHINKKYKKNKTNLELEGYKNTFANKLLETIQQFYGTDLKVLKYWDLGENITSFYLKIMGKNVINYNATKPFSPRGWINIDFKQKVFIPISLRLEYSSSFRAKQTITSTIEKTPDLFNMFQLISQMDCDIETEKTTILKSYQTILKKYNTTKKLLEDHPSIKRFMEFLWEDEKKTAPSETEKIIEKFESELD